MKKYWFFIPIVMIVIGIPVAIILMNKNKNNDTGNQNQEESNSDNETSDPTGTIYVEAGDGTLLNGGTYSYIAESARGWEAYLGDKSATAAYEFNSTSAGNYTLWVKLSDDAVHQNGDRNVTIVINNNQTRKYIHVSENTNGWKWFKIGEVPLTEGSNKITFTKDEDTYAAYVMDEFKFVPVAE